MTSYGSTYEGKLLFQAASSYCEVCHAFKFDFKDKKEFFAAWATRKNSRNTQSPAVSLVKNAMEKADTWLATPTT